MTVPFRPRPGARPQHRRPYPPKPESTEPAPPGRYTCGMQPVREAIRVHGSALLRVMVEEGGSPGHEALARFAGDRGAKVERVPRAELDRLAHGARHQGAAAYAPDLVLLGIDDAIRAAEEGPILLLDEIEDPQNFGAIVRSAVAFGAVAVVFPEHHAAPLSPAMFRASAGAVEHAKLVRVASLPNAILALKGAGIALVGLDASGDMPLAEVSLEGKTALVVGAEGKGLRRGIRSACDVIARLPMPGPLGSLNASAAAAVALYEVVRQRSAIPRAV